MLSRDICYHVSRLLRQRLEGRSCQEWQSYLEGFFATKIQHGKEDVTKKADLTQKIEILTDKMDETNAPVEEILNKIQEYHDQRLFLQASSHGPAIKIQG